jgi:hypothetical protein
MPVEYIPDQVVVKLKSALANDPHAQHAVMDNLPEKSEFEQHFNNKGRAIIHLPETADPLEVAQQLSEIDEVEFAEPNFLHFGE